MLFEIHISGRHLHCSELGVNNNTYEGFCNKFYYYKCTIMNYVHVNQ